jgi:hypothetical protein
MSFTETKVNLQRDEVDLGIANHDQLIKEIPEEEGIHIIGKDSIKVGYSGQYELEGVSGEITFSVSDEKLATIKRTSNSNICIVKANESNKLGDITLIAECEDNVYKKNIKIVPLW